MEEPSYACMSLRFGLQFFGCYISIPNRRNPDSENLAVQVSNGVSTQFPGLFAILSCTTVALEICREP